MSATAPAKGTQILSRPLGGPVPPSVLAAARLLTRMLAIALLFVLAGAIGLALNAQSHAGRVFEGVSAAGVRCVWLRHGLQTSRLRRQAIEARAATPSPPEGATSARRRS